MRLAHLYAPSEYNTAATFGKSLAEALRRQGCEVVDLSFSPYEQRTSLDLFQRLKPQASFSYNNLCVEGMKLPFAEITGVPHFTLCVGSGIYVARQFASPLSYVSFVDQKDLEFLSPLHPERSFFFPHASDPNLLLKPVPSKNRDLVFLGTCFDLDAAKAKWPGIFTKKETEVLLGAVDYKREHAEAHYMEALQETAKEKEALYTLESQMLFLLKELERVARGEERLSLLKTFCSFPLEVYGKSDGPKGWKDYLPKRRKAQVFPPVPFLKGVKILQEAKVSLHSCPSFPYGLHERVLTALLAGTAVVMPFSPLFAQHFSKEEGVLFYKKGEEEKIQEEVRELLKNEKKRSSLVKRGREKVLEKHSFDQRAALLKGLMASCSSSSKTMSLSSSTF